MLVLTLDTLRTCCVHGVLTACLLYACCTDCATRVGHEHVVPFFYCLRVCRVQLCMFAHVLFDCTYVVRMFFWPCACRLMLCCAHVSLTARAPCACCRQTCGSARTPASPATSPSSPTWSGSGPTTTTGRLSSPSSSRRTPDAG